MQPGEQLPNIEELALYFAKKLTLHRLADESQSMQQAVGYFFHTYDEPLEELSSQNESRQPRETGHAF
jgi:hypothetical protein